MLKHPNLVKCLGASTKSPDFFIVTELMSGGNLHNYLRRDQVQWDFDLLVVYNSPQFHSNIFFVAIGIGNCRANKLPSLFGYYTQAKHMIIT
jgi:hypothetical protein